jgi:N-carbamoyl-L-amino-acid hydrolase
MLTVPLQPRFPDESSMQLAQQLFCDLRKETSDTVGISRESFGHTENVGIGIIEAAARHADLIVERDGVSNLVVTLAGREPDLPYIACGSHIDSVPQGGNYDGAAGVIAGLTILASLRRDGVVPRRSLKLMCLRGEESAWFGRAYIGSSALFGRLSPADLALPHIRTGRPLGDCMRDAGADVDRIARGEKLIDPTRIAAWIELHIEQGPLLIARDLPVGIVTGIRGNTRHRCVECIGEAGHSGAVPRWLRRDAVFAAAELLTRLDRHWRSLLERGSDLVVTTGLFNTDPAESAISRIPGRVSFSFEARSKDIDTLDAFYELFRSECARIEEERGVEFRFDGRLSSSPALMDPDWIERLRAAARHLGLPDELMPSGAGHDAAVFAAAGVPSAMIFVRNENGSHNPDEAMEMDDFSIGLSLMHAVLMQALK